MAIYHLRMTSIAKAAGHSAGEKAKYIARLGQYARVRGGRQRDPVLHVESLHMPGWARDAAGEEAERRSAAALAYWQASDVGSRANGRVVEYEFALPREMTLEQQIELAREFAREVTQVEGGVLPATFAIHAGGGINVHAHLEVSEAINDGIERGPETWFKRAANPGKPPQSGGCRKTRELQRPERLVHLRERLAVLTNAALARYGHAARVDHRSYADRGLDIVPQEHVGRGPQAEAARARNARRRSVNDRARELQAELEQITQTHAATAALTEAPDDRHRPDQHRPGAAGLPRHGHVAPSPAGAERPGPGPHLGGPAAAAGPDLAGARIDGPPAAAHTRAADEPGAATPARGATAADDSRVRDVSRGRLDERRNNLVGLLYGDKDNGLHARGSGRHHGVRWERQGAGDEQWRLDRERLAQPSSSPRLRFAKPGNELLQAQRAWMEVGQAMAERWDAWVEQHAAVRAAAKAAKAGAPKVAGAAPHPPGPSLAKTPSLARMPRLTAVSLRSVDRLSDRDLHEQQVFAERGRVALAAQMGAALDAGERDPAAHLQLQVAARRARIESLRAVSDRRAREAVTTPPAASVDPAPPAAKSIQEIIMDLSTTQLREREAIATAAMREAGRLAAAGGAGAAAAAQRLRDSMARLGTIRAELAARAEREAPAQPAAVEVPAPAEIHAPPPASEPERDEIAEAVERLAEATDVAETAARDVRLRQAIARAWRGVDRAKAQQASASWLRPGSQREADAAHEAALNKVRAAAATACTAGQANTHNRQHNAVALESSRAHAELAEEERERRAKHVADLQRAQQKARDAASLAAANRDLAARVEADKAKADAERGAEAERRRLAATQPVKPTPARPTTPPRHHYPIPGVRRRD